MKKIVLLMFVIMAFFLSSDLQAFEVLKSPDNEFNIGGRMQILGVIESLNDPYKDDQRITLFLKQSRLFIYGKLKGVAYRTELMLGGEELPKTNMNHSLQDYYIGFHLFNCRFTGTSFSLRTGQFKVPYSREELLDDEDLDNADKSISDLGFKLGRDLGMALYTDSGKFAASFGIFTGAGINIPQRYLPQTFGIPLTVLRIGYNNGLDKDALTPNHTGKSDKIKYAAYLNALYTKDFRHGHGTTLSAKTTDRSLLLHPNWNPFISSLVSAPPTDRQRSFEQAEFWQGLTSPRKFLSAQTTRCRSCSKRTEGVLPTVKEGFILPGDFLRATLK